MHLMMNTEIPIFFRRCLMRKGNGSLVSALFAFFVFSIFFTPGIVEAQDKDRIKDLEKRIERLERKDGDTSVSSERSHRLHPVHSEFGLEITGGITLTLQGVANVQGQKRTEAAISGDLAVEGPIGANGLAVIVLDLQQGLGVEGLGLLAAPNGNPTGPNADVESFNDMRINVTQLYYEHHFLDGGLTVSVGQLDITGYLDANEFANDETGAFLANVFVNNPSIEFGGSDNFYSPGLALVFSPAGKMDLAIGAFDGDGDYARPFDAPFLMAEADFRPRFLGKEGTYRVYYWRRSSRPAANLEFLADPTKTALVKAFNQGVGLSFDQYIGHNLGLWLRGGTQRETVSQMKAFLGTGLHASAALIGREHDSMGLGYGVNFLGRDYREYRQGSTRGFDPGNEHYIEVYYDVFLSGLGGMGLHLAPDFQYIINRGGNRRTTDAFLYGLRIQADF